jgi:4-amino-4-deoxy-L-arabinose transferase-like glycosyltransferase
LNTEKIPHVLSGDEASSGLSAVEFINGETDNIFSVGWFSFPSFFYFIQSIPIRLLGQTTPALRLLSASGGALTVVAVYWLARELFGELTGLVAGIYMAGFHYHINFSRIGLNNIWDGLWFVVTLGLIWKGWRTEQRRYFIFSGLSLGLSQYFYVSSRLIPVIIIIWVILVSLIDFSRLKRLWAEFFLVALVALVVFLPLGVFFANHMAEFSAPMNRVTIFGEWMENTMRITGKSYSAIMFEQLKTGFQGFTHVPLNFWYEPETPLLRPFAATAFLLGMILLVIKPKDDRFLLLGLWVFSFALTISFSESAPAAQRFVGVTPATAILVGFGITESLKQIGEIWPGIQKLLVFLSLAIVSIISLDDIRFYFFEYVPNSQFGGDHTLIAQDLADLLQNRSSECRVFFFGAPHMGYKSISSIEYLAPHIEGIDINYPWKSPGDPASIGNHLLFVFLNDHEADLKAVRESYPNGTLREVYRKYPAKGLLYWSYEVINDEDQ